MSVFARLKLISMATQGQRRFHLYRVKNYTGYVALNSLSCHQVLFLRCRQVHRNRQVALLAQASDNINAGSNSFDVYAEAGNDVTDAIFASVGEVQINRQRFLRWRFRRLSFANASPSKPTVPMFGRCALAADHPPLLWRFFLSYPVFRNFGRPLVESAFFSFNKNMKKLSRGMFIWATFSVFSLLAISCASTPQNDPALPAIEITIASPDEIRQFGIKQGENPYLEPTSLLKGKLNEFLILKIHFNLMERSKVSIIAQSMKEDGSEAGRFYTAKDFAAFWDQRDI